MPRIAAIAVASAPAATPSRSERRAPMATCEKMSLPWSVVPKRWCQDGAWRAASRLKSFGWADEISGAISAMTTTNETMPSPRHDLRLWSSSTNQPGTRSRPSTRRGGAVMVTFSAGSSCDISRSGASGRGRD